LTTQLWPGRQGILFWVYLINAILIIVHEIDSAYWQEWNLFRIPGGITVFLLLHIPIIFLILYGLILIYEKSSFGLILSLLLGAGGIFAFSVHTWFIRKGREEFKTPVSQTVLVFTLLFSMCQIFLTMKEMTG